MCLAEGTNRRGSKCTFSEFFYNQFLYISNRMFLVIVSLVNPLSRLGAFQWTWNLHTTLDVKGKSAHYYWHILFVETNFIMKNCKEKYLFWSKIWEYPTVSKLGQLVQI